VVWRIRPSSFRQRNPLAIKEHGGEKQQRYRAEDGGHSRGH